MNIYKLLANSLNVDSCTLIKIKVNGRMKMVFRTMKTVEYRRATIQHGIDYLINDGGEIEPFQIPALRTKLIQVTDRPPSYAKKWHLEHAGECLDMLADTYLNDEADDFGGLV